MPTPTYKALATTTLTSATTIISFTGINQGFRDLILVGDGTFNDNALIQFSFGSGFTGERAYMYSNTVSANTMPDTSTFWAPVGTSRPTFAFHLRIFEYAQTDKHKNALIRSSNDISTGMASYRAATTSAISSITIRNNSMWNFQIGSTFSLYGVIA